MLIVTSRAEAKARSRQVHVNGRDYTIDEYVGSAPKRGHYVAGNEANDDGRPQGFLVHKPANAVTPAHFHEPNQFQVFVGGSGRMGAFPAAPLTVQYANGHTPYGPIVASDEGVMYFTLRQRWDPGAKYLPASRDLLRKGNQRTRIKGGIGVAEPAERLARTATTIETVMPPEADGLAAWMWRLAPGGEAALPGPADTGGQYLIVAGGTLRSGGVSLDHLSTVFVTPEEPAYTARAGTDGLDLLVLQFPRARDTLAGGSSVG
ncbi:MAG: hypothetical protein SFW09_01045 [Hyphomicrobiaceae bacterium]|nr:hypothetical protein [Hyphomicrobiaceae bacterium]